MKPKPSRDRRRRTEATTALKKRRGASGARRTGTASAGAKRTVRRRPKPIRLGSLDLEKAQSLQAEVERLARGTSPARWNADPDDVQRSVVKLVLTLVEVLRQLLERQAIRRMESGTLTDTQTEDIGRALMKLEETVRDLAARFGIPVEELNLDLGPVGKLV